VCAEIQVCRAAPKYRSPGQLIVLAIYPSVPTIPSTLTARRSPPLPFFCSPHGKYFHIQIKLTDVDLSLMRLLVAVKTAVQESFWTLASLAKRVQD
jgi:hypothetical protein